MIACLALATSGALAAETPPDSAAPPGIDSYARAGVFHGTCRLKVLDDAFEPCAGKTEYAFMPDGGAALMFSDDLGTYTIWGKTDLARDADNHDFAAGRFRWFTEGKSAFDDTVRGDCRINHSGTGAARVFHSIRCEIYSVQPGASGTPLLRIYLENVTRFDDLKAGPAVANVPATGRRIALVVGNSAYLRGALDNPRNDADLMARTLEAIGFEVTRLIDANQSAMKRAMLDFSRKARAGADATLFYYAGHAVQIDGENYLIPVEAEIEDAAEVAVEAVNVNDFLTAMKSAASKVNIVVLDACRNNPFGSATRGLGGGLAMIDAPSGTYLAYATAPGQVATEGAGTNSPYTKALAATMKVPGMRIEDVFKEVRRIVIAETRQQQVPWDTTSVTSDFYFVP